MIRFSTCAYIEENHHIILSRASGSGNTYIACALGNTACRKIIDSHKKPELLILDEWLLRTITGMEAYNLLEIVEARSNSSKGSMIFCTQYLPDDWYDRLNSESPDGSPITEAIMDRIIHNSYNVFIDRVISMRKRHGISFAENDGGRS